ncbi:polymer-forming cytoskeletal protein [Candidatus Gracilibacteria bacterium]|nr:polymer-forming cytoskeletal protein [Candidatus Gracilibacteria bacterium]
MFQNQTERDTGLPQATTIGEQVTISGTLASDGNVNFNGLLEKGMVRINGMLTVGNNATIRGTVEVGKLVVNGLIVGNVAVKEDLEIGATGHIDGDIIVEGQLTITKGGTFNGKCDMGKQTAAVEESSEEASTE